MLSLKSPLFRLQKKWAVETLIAVCITLLLLSTCNAVFAQNVGINTDTPTKMLSVAGSIAVDHDNENTGTLDSAALVFGTGPSLTGISSNKSAASPNQNGLDFWTNGQRSLVIGENGHVGISTSEPDPFYDLEVGGQIKSYGMNTNNLNVNVSAIFDQEINVAYRVNVNGNEHSPQHRLSVNNGDSYFDGDGDFNGSLIVGGNLTAQSGITATQDIASFNQVRGLTLRATDHMAVGGLVDPVYRLRVWDGNSRFGGNVQITGVLDVGDIEVDDITADDVNADDLVATSINGSGIVHSAGPSSLQVGFTYEDIHFTLNGGSQVDDTAPITPFTGSNYDARVFVSQFVPDPLPEYANWHDFSFHIHSVDPVTDTCKIRITNTTNAQLSIKGTLYLTSIVKD